MKKILSFLIVLIATSSLAQITHYNWPTGAGEALLSDKYQVFVTYGTNPEEEVEVLMSLPDPNDIKNDPNKSDLETRSFSYATISYDLAGGQSVKFRIVKKFGNASTKVKIAPKSYNIIPTVGSNEVSFTLNTNNKYISVNFEDTANQTLTKKWINHMLTINVDPAETSVPQPTDQGVVVYSNSVPPGTLDAATTIYFPAGYHILRNYQYGSTTIPSDGILHLGTGKKIYLAGGAYVEGLVKRSVWGVSNQKIYGRGVLSGKNYIWQDEFGNKPYGQIVEMGSNSEVNGIHIVDSPQHGIVSTEGMKVENLKFLGWHANNDGLRIGTNSVVKNSFIRAVDDFFYNYNINVSDCVLWAGHNGAIMTYGWASIDTGSSHLENIDIINPEWTGLGNNNGLIAAQVNLDFNPKDYGTGTTTSFKNIRIEGSIPGLTNIKPRSNSNGVPEASPVDVANLGYLGDVHMENITVESQFAKGRIRGQANATTTGTNTYYSKNINFTNVTIGGVKLTDLNSSLYFDIEAATTQNITFDIGIPSPVTSVQTETFTSATVSHLSTNVYATTEKGITKAELEAVPVGKGKLFTADTNTATEGYDYELKNTGGNPSDYLARTSGDQYAKGVAYVYNNTNGDASGTLNMSFAYFAKAPITADRVAYRVWGVKSTISDSGTNKEYFRMTGGTGTSGDNAAVSFVTTGNTDVVDLSSNMALGLSDTWKTVNFNIDVTPYKYIVIMVASTYGSTQVIDAGAPLFGLDNLVVPTNVTPLNTNSFENKNLISVFPNPTSNQLYLHNVSGKFDYKIYNPFGQIIKSALNNTTTSIDVSSLANGVYLLEVKNDQNHKEIIKFIKN